MPTIGVIGHNGRVGAAIFSTLLQSRQAKVVVLHRPDSKNLSAIPSGIEARVLDLANGSLEDRVKALAGLDTVVAAIGGAGSAGQLNLAEAIAACPDPPMFWQSNYGIAWLPEDWNRPALSMLKGHIHLSDKCQELKLDTALVKCGAFTDLVFGPRSAVGINTKANTMEVLPGSMTNKLPISSVEYIGTGTAQLALLPPSEVKGKTFKLIEYEATGKQLADVLTKVNGTSPKVTEITQEDIEKLYEGDMFRAISAPFRSKWGTQRFDYLDAVPYDTKDWDRRGLETICKEFKEMPDQSNA